MQPVTRDHLVLRDLRDPLDLPDRQALLETRVHPDPLETGVLPVSQATLDQLDFLALLDSLGHPDRLDREANRVCDE